MNRMLLSKFVAIAMSMGLACSGWSFSAQAEDRGAAWLAQQRELGRVAERASKSGDVRELRDRRYEPSKMLGRMSDLPEAVRPACAVAMQALANYWRDLISSPDQASADRAQWQSWQPRCEKALARRP